MDYSDIDVIVACVYLFSEIWNIYLSLWIIFQVFFLFEMKTYNLLDAHSPKLILDKHRYEIFTSLDLFHVHVIQFVGIS